MFTDARRVNKICSRFAPPPMPRPKGSQEMCVVPQRTPKRVPRNVRYAPSAHIYIYLLYFFLVFMYIIYIYYYFVLFRFSVGWANGSILKPKGVGKNALCRRCLAAGAYLGRDQPPGVPPLNRLYLPPQLAAPEAPCRRASASSSILILAGSSATDNHL